MHITLHPAAPAPRSTLERVRLAAGVTLSDDAHGTLARIDRGRRTVALGRRESDVLRAVQDAPSVEQWEARCQLTMSRHELAVFRIHAERLGILDGAESRSHLPYNARRIRLVHLPIPSFIRPRPALTVLVRMLFIGSFLAAAAIVWLAITSPSVVVGTIGSALSLTPDHLLWTFASVLLLGVLHELAHAIAIVRYGGSVFEIGFMIANLLPSFYVDVTGISRLRRSGQRIAVWFAGMGLQIVLLAATLVLEALAPVAPEVSVALQSFAVTNAGMLLLNALFVLRFDGHRILCELLAIPQLGNRDELRRAGQAGSVAGSGLEYSCRAIATLAGVLFVPLLVANVVAGVLGMLAVNGTITTIAAISTSTGIVLVAMIQLGIIRPRQPGRKNDQ